MTDLELRQIFWDEFSAEGLSRDGLLCPTIAVERAIVAAMRRAAALVPARPMADSDYESMAKSAYTIYRGADTSNDTPDHWDDLTKRQRDPLIFVAKFSFNYPK